MKYKRDQIKMDTQITLKEINRELGVRTRVYPEWIERKKLSAYTAAQRYVALLEVKELLEEMIKRNISMKQAKEMFQVHEVKEPQQGNLFRKPKNPM